MVPENDIDYGSREIPAWIEDATDAILLQLMNFPPDAETTANRLIQPYLHYIDANGVYRERPYDLFTGECDVVDTLHRKARDHGLCLDSSAYDGMIIGAPGSIPFRVRRLEEIRSDKRRGIVFGAAVGDALGVPYEFLKRDTFECTGMSGGGIHGKPAGTFSDDTSLLLATCASLKERGEVDVEDMRPAALLRLALQGRIHVRWERLRRWKRHGDRPRARSRLRRGALQRQRVPHAHRPARLRARIG